MTSSLEIDFYLLQFKEIRSNGCVFLNEGYERAANRGRKIIRISNQNITYQPSMIRQIFLVGLFYWFFETADLRVYCGYFLAICELCSESAKLNSPSLIVVLLTLIRV